MNNKRGKKSIAEGARENRRMVLWLLCGGYLLYLAFQLGKSLFAGEVKAGTETIIAWGGCATFGAVGLVLLFLCARMGIRSFQDSLSAAGGEEQETLPEGAGPEDESSPENEPREEAEEES